MLWRKPNLKTRYVLELENPKEEKVICCMDFAFIGGSMGAVVGENLKRNQSFYQKQNPFIMISKSGGARMMLIL
jgi:acetyl-CoA carboxylase carboxyl transferase subunit beta